MKNFSPSILALLFSITFFTVSAQTKEERQKISQSYNQESATKITQKVKAFSKQQELEVERLVTEGLAKKRFNQLVGAFSDGSPIYYSIENQDSGVATGAADFYTGGSLGLTVNGENMVAYVWDGGRVFTAHQEFNTANKIEQVDDADEDGDSRELNGQSFHATHITVTFAARGANPAGKGMAPQATIKAYIWTDDLNEINSAGFNGALVSNQSYGLNANTIPDWVFGAYISQCVNYDLIINGYEYFLPVTSAGNNGSASNDDDNTEPLNGNSAYDKLSFLKIIKNNLVVANGANPSFDANGNVTSFSINSTSSEGPTNDLRIKPDITGIETSVTSCVDSATDHYNTFTGTSMASPTVAGTLLLVQQYFNGIHGQFMKANSLKGVALHTAIDGDGTEGPDAKAGWGLINGRGIANIINNNGSTTLLQERSLANGASYSTTVASDGTEPLKASISWLDVGDASVAYNGATTGTNNGPKALINDLDLRVTQETNTYYPWRLTDVDANANDGDNDRDPFERVDIMNPVAGNYDITVTHKGALVNPESYTLIVSGATAVSLSTNEFSKDDEFHIYPNPTQDILNVNFTNAKNNIKISLIDIQGRQVLNKNYSNKSNQFSKQLNIENLSDGIYILSINNGRTISNKRIIKK